MPAQTLLHGCFICLENKHGILDLIRSRNYEPSTLMNNVVNEKLIDVFENDKAPDPEKAAEIIVNQVNQHVYRLCLCLIWMEVYLNSPVSLLLNILLLFCKVG